MPINSTGNLRRIIGALHEQDLSQMLRKLPINIGKLSDALKGFCEKDTQSEISQPEISKQKMSASMGRPRYH